MTPRVLLLSIALVLCGPAYARAQLAAECPLAEARPETQALILWVSAAHATLHGARLVGPVRAVARLRRGKLEPTDGENLRDGMRVWNALEPGDSPLALSTVTSFLDQSGEARCVYAADVRPGQPKGTLLSSARRPGAFRAPSPQDVAYFRSQNPQAELLALSDLDADGALEYWASEPTPGDTAVSVWQRTSMGLERVFGSCSGCSE